MTTHNVILGIFALLLNTATLVLGGQELRYPAGHILGGTRTAAK